MAECNSIEFDEWLKETLIRLNTDDEIFSPYIKGIVETDDPIEEKKESLEGIVSSITEDGIEELCKEILSKWSISNPTPLAETSKAKPTESASLDDRLVQLMGKQSATLKLAPPKPPKRTDNTALKKAILAQYSQVSGDEDEACDSDDEVGATGGGCGGGGGGLAKNNNAAAVDQEVREKREQSKQDHKVKKEKDKEEREKQKTKADERKEKEKKRTQKGERRR